MIKDMSQEIIYNISVFYEFLPSRTFYLIYSGFYSGFFADSNIFLNSYLILIRAGLLLSINSCETSRPTFPSSNN